MFSPVAASASHTYFENSVGRLLEHPAGHYIVVEYNSGPRQLSDIQPFLAHAGQLLARWGWDKLLGQQGLMTAFTPEETEWAAMYWRTQTPQPLALLYGAQLLPHNVFSHLSWKSGQAA